MKKIKTNRKNKSLLLSRWKQYSCDAQYEEQDEITKEGDNWWILTTRANRKWVKKNRILKKIKKVARTFIFLHEGQPLWHYCISPTEQAQEMALFTYWKGIRKGTSLLFIYHKDCTFAKLFCSVFRIEWYIIKGVQCSIRKHKSCKIKIDLSCKYLQVSDCQFFVCFF